MFTKQFTRISRILIAGLGIVCAHLTNAQADPGKTLCYLWAHNASPALNTPYTPSTIYSFNATHQGISVTKVATGTYVVTCRGVGGGSQQGPGGHVQVSSYGDGVNTFCHVGSWATGGADFSATVDCFGKGGGTGGG